MTVGILIPIPRAFVLTATANSLVGAELYVYQNLTTTPVTLYSDRACTTPAANPIVSSAGFFPRRYMASAQLLTLTLKNTAGSTVHSDDYVAGSAESGNEVYDIALTTAGGTTAYTLTTGLSLGAYASGVAFLIKMNATNTGASTLNVDGLGAKDLTKNGSTALSSGDLVSGRIYRVAYDGTRFQVVGVIPDTTAALTLPQGRLTLESGVPVSTSDQTAKTTIYYTPHVGNVVPLYDGTSFTPTAFTELSQATTDNTKSPAAVANDSNYDLFVWSDSGTVRCTRGPAWSSATARGTGAGTTELELVKGVYLNKVAITNGPAANRGTFVGTVRSNGSAQINDSVLLRMVWNAYNRLSRPMSVVDTTDSWNYTTLTWRQARATATNQLAFVRGLNEDEVLAFARGLYSNSSLSVLASVGVGLDSTSANSAAVFQAATTYAANSLVPSTAEYRGFPGLGYHYLAWLEISQATGTGTFYGDAGTTLLQSGLTATVYS